MVVCIINQSIACTLYTDVLPQYNSVHPIAVSIYKCLVDDNVVFFARRRAGFL